MPVCVTILCVSCMLLPLPLLLIKHPKALQLDN